MSLLVQRHHRRGKAFWKLKIAAYEAANPGVTIKVQTIQNEDMDGKLQTALNSGDAPDIFMARGGGQARGRCRGRSGAGARHQRRD